MLTSRERVALTLNHRAPDRVPLDIGGTVVTSMHVSAVYKLRQALKLDPSGTPVKVVEPYQMLGEIAPDLAEALGVDTTGLGSPYTMFGYRNEGWKPWATFDGTPVLVPSGFNTVPEPDGSIFMYPQGDRQAPPSARLPAGGFYFDSIIRQDIFEEENLDPADNVEEHGPIDNATLEYFRDEAGRLYDETNRAIVANFGGTSFGDIALVPAPQLRHPKGIRDVEMWYVSLITRRDYVREVFALQSDIALSNLEKIYRAVGNRVTVAMVSGADFGSQRGPLISPKMYRALFLPFHKRINSWIHTHTTWKTILHTCGSVMALLPELSGAGFDILNPVQISAAHMDPQLLKDCYGDRMTFWGGGIDTQKTLPFGTPEQVRAEVRDRMAIFGRDGGFVFNTIHNVQAKVPAENLLALFQAVRDFR